MAKKIFRKYSPGFKFLAEMSVSFLLQPYTLLKNLFYEVEIS